MPTILPTMISSRRAVFGGRPQVATALVFRGGTSLAQVSPGRARPSRELGNEAAVRESLDQEAGVETRAEIREPFPHTTTTSPEET